MRSTVLSSDLLIFFPSALYFVYAYRLHVSSVNGNNAAIGWQLAMILLNPCLILIDHGHFQVCSFILDSKSY